VHQENVERMLLATYVAGLTGTPGRQVRYANPQTVQQVLQIALSVQEAEKQERFNNSFYTRFENSVNLH
jgi:protein involved in polysaccharide export with SLBB domain